MVMAEPHPIMRGLPIRPRPFVRAVEPLCSPAMRILGKLVRVVRMIGNGYGTTAMRFEIKTKLLGVAEKSLTRSQAVARLILEFSI